MKKIIVFLSLVFTGLLVGLSTAVPLQAAIPAAERAALIALYNATNGDNWTNNSGWKGNNNEPDGFSKIGSEGSWYGITVSDNHVYYILLSDNQLIGTIPPELGNLSQLYYLYLNRNQLNGSIPPELGNLSNLVWFFLNRNQLSGSIPPELGNLSSLGYFSFSDNQLTGSIPPELGNLSNVKNFGLNRNQLSGSIPPELGNLASLEGLGLGYNQLTGSIPPELANPPNLWELNLSGNQLSGSIPPELGNIENLYSLFLKDNQLTGSIPAELGKLDKLEILELQNNMLTGSIPAELDTLSSLRYFFLSSNQVSGTIPQELANLPDLDKLYLDNNQLSGSIPPELGKLGNLRYLFLDHNRLSGSIPTELGNLSGLYALRLNANKLSGEIPTSLTNLTGLFQSYFDISYNALYTDDEALRTFLTNHDYDWDTTQTIAPTNISAAAISATTIRVFWTAVTYTWDNGGYNVYYSTTSGGPWTYSGMATDKSATSYDVTGLNPGTTYYLAVKTVTNPHAYNLNTVASDYSVEVSAATNPLGPDLNPPFGTFETPIDGSTVYSSIPVTGWVLDDTGIDNVKIYRAQGNTLVYIGDGVLVEGARPDVAIAYPGYPNNTKAGWGYMMLTNFLPGGGNGTFVIHALATDRVGKTTTLGTKTIYCDNANAVKPFGAIDTPTQGGIASGSSFINWGWALTPYPNSIPTDGSTMNVYVDGVNIGHPTYNNYRVDIAGLFPDCVNSNGAAGYFYLDTTAYDNGVHTIQWTATDNAGNTDGIGSRYFTIQNTGGDSQLSIVNSHRSLDNKIPPSIPVDSPEPVTIKKGYNPDTEPEIISPDDEGMITIQIKESERLEIHLFEGTRGLAPLPDAPLSRCTGYLLIGNQLRSLPIGSTLDTQRGIFSWQPGPGFLRRYNLVFLETSPNGIKTKKNIYVEIVPQTAK
ncbi:MAG: fibronectin type III domain-containing protein [Candidatus Aminicenantes bacterium]|jgi:Leucine-rich repeat (LRR) protein